MTEYSPETTKFIQQNHDNVCNVHPFSQQSNATRFIEIAFLLRFHNVQSSCVSEFGYCHSIYA